MTCLAFASSIGPNKAALPLPGLLATSPLATPHALAGVPWETPSKQAIGILSRKWGPGTEISHHRVVWRVGLHGVPMTVIAYFEDEDRLQGLIAASAPIAKQADLKGAYDEVRRNLAPGQPGKPRIDGSTPNGTNGVKWKSGRYLATLVASGGKHKLMLFVGANLEGQDQDHGQHTPTHSKTEPDDPEATRQQIWRQQA
jgi:hypothetical protein